MATFLNAKWENIIMANYSVAPEVLQPFLPKGVELDLYNGKAYISLVGFMFKDTKIFKIPIPYFGTFEEINLRFYVKRIEADVEKRGVVFINETIPYKIVAWMANKLYKEHYTTIPTKHSIKINEDNQQIEYYWKINNKWNNIIVNATLSNTEMQKDSFEEYIFEHYFGYTKVDESNTEEYCIAHPAWKINLINKYSIDCDFEAMYGKPFAHLTNAVPDSIFIAEGSGVSVDWKRNRLKLND
jgi:uncharacterized protein